MSNRLTRSERRAARRRRQRLIILLVIILILAGAAFIVYSALGNKQAASLKINDLVVGAGAEAKTGSAVTVHYTGWLEDGTQFDSSLDSGQPFQFVIGRGQVIQGWDQGVTGMKVGGKRQLIIPPHLAYGAQGYPGAIPPNATLTFEVELLDVK